SCSDNYMSFSGSDWYIHTYHFANKWGPYARRIDHFRRGKGSIGSFNGKAFVFLANAGNFGLSMEPEAVLFGSVDEGITEQIGIDQGVGLAFESAGDILGKIGRLLTDIRPAEQVKVQPRFALYFNPVFSRFHFRLIFAHEYAAQRPVFKRQIQILFQLFRQFLADQRHLAVKSRIFVHNGNIAVTSGGGAACDLLFFYQQAINTRFGGIISDGTSHNSAPNDSQFGMLCCHSHMFLSLFISMMYLTF